MPVSKEIANGHIYDIIVIGGGPAGYTAALYAARTGFDTVILEKLSPGGQMALTPQIDNYPGFDEGIDGFTLGQKMRYCAERFGAVSKFSEVLSVELTGQIKEVQTPEGLLLGRAVIIATGADPRKLNVKGETEFFGKGISYCANCDGMFYKDKTVAVVGGGNTAAEDVLILSRICKSVLLIHRRSTLKAEKIYRDALSKASNVTFIWDNSIIEFFGNEKLNGIKLQNAKSHEEQIIACDGVFVSIGRTPSTNLVKDQLLLDSSGYIIADESTRTSISGVFAIGDVRTKAVRQIVTAVSDGAVAVHYAEEYLIGGAD